MPKANKGFTLMEVLVSLAMASLLVAILMSALYYVFRVEDVLRSEVVEREAALRSMAWFSGALSGCLPAEKTAKSAFVGSEREVRCETTNPVLPHRLPMPVHVTFMLKTERTGVVLDYREIDAPEGVRETDANTIATWPDKAGVFRYIDDGGQELDHWPPDRSEHEALPRMIKLVLSGRGAVSEVWLVALDADPWLPPKVGNPLGIDLPR